MSLLVGKIAVSGQTFTRRHILHGDGDLPQGTRYVARARAAAAASSVVRALSTRSASLSNSCWRSATVAESLTSAASRAIVDHSSPESRTCLAPSRSAAAPARSSSGAASSRKSA